jgi:hypothetical protein
MHESVSILSVMGKGSKRARMRASGLPITSAVFFLMVCALAGFASPASAETPQPWFHLASGARPTYLFHGGQAKSEVQELTVKATGGKCSLEEEPVGPNGCFWIKRPNHEGHATVKYNATPEEMKADLQEIYGAGNVMVTGGPGDEKGTHPYVITFTGELADQQVEPMEPLSKVFEFFEITTKEGKAEGSATVTEVTHGKPDGEIIATAINVGDAATTTENSKSEPEPVELTDTLPEHLKPVSAHVAGGLCSLSGQDVQCTLEAPLAPFGQVEVRVGVLVEPGASTGELNHVGVSGGGAPHAAISRPITISSSPAPFGVEDYELTPEDVGGVLDTQAGSHPFQLTTTFVLNQTAGGIGATTGLYETQPVAIAKDLSFKLPPGLLGNPHPFAQCTPAQFSAQQVSCPQNSVLGAAVVTFGEPGLLSLHTKIMPVYNLEPQEGEPARFGFRPLRQTPVFLDTFVRTGEDYGVTVTVDNISQEVGFVSNTVTLWGVPGAASHDNQRGDSCLQGAEAPLGPCEPLEAVSPPPFLDLPGSCTNEPLHTEVLVDSWADPSQRLPFTSTAPMPELDGCNELPFSAEVRVTPDVQEASRPSGLTVDVHVPQAGALIAEAITPTELKNITVVLPEGLDLNPSAADGLQACTQAEVALSSDAEPSCPNASKIADVKIKTPLLANPLTGFVYLASPQNFAGLPENPFSSLVAMYLVAKDPVSGTLVKLPGSVSLNQATGQITSTFQNNPQLPFEDAELKFFGGERAPLSTPSRCGVYTTNATFEPWSGNPPISNTSTFNITSGPGGGPCPGSTLPFSPSLASGTTNNNAGAFTPLTTTLSRPDGNQDIQSVVLHYPPGVSGMLKGVPLCPEAQANAGTCGPESQIGETIVSVGVGGDPFTVTGGKVYLTEKYQGAPFGLSIVNPAKAGPFNLQEGKPVVVRAKIEINPITAALTVTTGDIPSIVEGFALQIQHVNVLINRPGFTFNPTNCAPTAVTGAIDSAEGASSPVSVPFQVTNCTFLKFTPKFSVSTSGKTSRAGGASLTAKVTEPSEPFGSQANISKVKVELPKQLPSRLTTLQKACTAAQFEVNPAGCPTPSVIGHAKVITPLVPVPLEGPIYFVSHGGEAFPSLEIVLQGYGVKIVLVGATFISKSGVTSTTFKTVPDQPFSSFALTLPEGKFSALAATGNLCTSKLAMPTEFLAQNGAAIHQNTPISVTGCKKTKALTRAQKLTAALKVCRKKARGKQAACVKTARKQFGPIKKKAKKK